MKGSSYAFESVDLVHYILHKISLNRGRSYIDSPDWIKNKKATINPKKKDNECYKYAITTASNYSKINNHPEKKYLNLSLLSIIIIGKTLSFHHIQRIGKSLNKIIRQLLLISYLYHTIPSK